MTINKVNKTAQGWDDLSLDLLLEALKHHGYGEGWELWHSGGGIMCARLVVKDQWLGDEDEREYIVGFADYPNCGMDVRTETGSYDSSQTFGKIWVDFVTPDELAANIWQHITEHERLYAEKMAPGNQATEPKLKVAMRLGELIDVLYSYKIAAIDSGRTPEQAALAPVFITNPNDQDIDETANTIEVVGAWLNDHQRFTTEPDAAAAEETGFNVNIVLGRGAAFNIDL